MSLKSILKKTKTYEVGLAQMLVTKTTSSKRSHILEQHGLSSIEWFVLGLVCNETAGGGIRVTDLATILEVKTTYITSILRLLKDKGYVQTGRNPHDARVRLVTATAKAIQTVDTLEEGFQEATEQALSSKVTDEQFRNYIHVLQAIARIEC